VRARLLLVAAVLALSSSSAQAAPVRWTSGLRLLPRGTMPLFDVVCVGGVNTCGGAGGSFSGGVVTGKTTFGSAVDAAGTVRMNDVAGCITFEGSSADAQESMLCATNPTVGDQTFNLPNLAAGATDTIATLGAANVFTGANTFTDSVFKVCDEGDGTKCLQFQVSPVTTANTVTPIRFSGTSAAVSTEVTNQFVVQNQAISSNRFSVTTGANTVVRIDSTGSFGISSGDAINQSLDTSFTRAAAGIFGMTSSVRGGDGSVSNPTYAWTSQTNSGFFLRATNVIAFAQGGGNVTEWAGGANQLLRIHPSYRLVWSGSTDAAGTADIGLERLAAGVFKVNGGAAATAGWIQQAAARSMLAADYTNATAGFTTTALSVTVASGRKYDFRLSLFLADSTAADGAQIDFNGGTAAATNFRVHCLLYDTTTTVQNSSQATALATAHSKATLSGTGQHLWECTGSFEPSGAGTFIVRGAQVAHSTGTLTINRGSYLWIEDMP
jgi:hypothetical protein